MKDFVEECRREWRRLRVPDPVADEMASELAADLEEADAEGASPEDVLGAAAADPRSFAAAWAAERGLGRQPTARGWSGTRAFLLAAVAPLAAIVVSGVVLMLVASPPRHQRLIALPPPPSASPTVVWDATPDAQPLRLEASSGTDTHAVGVVLLIVGLAGIVLVTLLGVGYDRWSRAATSPIRSRRARPTRSE